MTHSRLVRLFDECGQSPWLDNLKREYITSGSLQAILDTGIRGLTSNPTIFQKAIQGSQDYDEQFRQLAILKHSPIESYWELVIKDIQDALDVFRPLYESSNHSDGFVSVEVDPNLAHDSAATEKAARDLDVRVDRDNVMIKIPATQEGIPVIRTMISEGRNVNVTLIFSLDRYQDVMNAYIDGLEILSNNSTGSLSGVSSVASFFISRVDTEIDKRLLKVGTEKSLELCGTAAISQAKLAYQLFSQTFSGPRWAALVRRGARVQRPLWASTSTKNPSYPDTLYVDQLIGADTVNTLPDNTMLAFSDHGTPSATIQTDVDLAHTRWHALEAMGIDVAEVALQLETEGVRSFQQSFTELIDALKMKDQAFHQ
jgi:transaldolase